MSSKQLPPEHQLIAVGNENIQVVGSNNIVQRITNIFQGDTEAQRARRNRRAMLQLVKNTWIKGVLEKSLYNEVLIELGMEERPDVVDHPWDVQVQMPDKENRILPAGTSMIEVFDEMNSAMLILGEPGSGKTTMLLELARDCILRAEWNENQPIPTIFNLSSWNGRQPIDNWLVDELRTKYNVPKKTAQNWVTNDDLLFLLDGLDEVKLENRERCVKAINDFRQEHGLTMPLAVCSRIADYEALPTKLNLSNAILLQALTLEQIEEYFERAGPELEAAYQTLQSDRILQQMVKQPLMLSILTLTYLETSIEISDSERSRSIEDRRKQMFDAYMQQMFERFARTKNERYTPEQTKRWLAWLAQKMITHNTVPYLVENMQPEWLNGKDRWGYRLSLILSTGLSSLLVSGLMVSLVVTVILWRAAADASLSDILTGGPLIGLLILCCLMTPIFVGGIIVGLIFGNREIKMVDTITLDWKRAIKGLIIGLGIGGGIGMLGPVILGFQGKLIAKLIIGLIFGLLIFGPLFGLIGGLVGGIKPKDLIQTTYPGQRIYSSIRNSSLVFLFTGLIVFLFYLVYVVWIIGGKTGQDFGLLSGLIFGLIAGLIGGFWFGGFTIMQHYNLRFIISFNNFLPWRPIPFLDYCVDRIFLRRVGGGYIFVHRLLMEHFANMYLEM